MSRGVVSPAGPRPGAPVRFGKWRVSMQARCMAAASAFAGVALVVSSAAAAPMDFALERLVTNASDCRNADGTTTGTDVCQTDDDAFRQLVSQFGMALAPNGAYPARTTGYSGFELLADVTFTKMDKSSDALIRGTRGATDPNTGRSRPQNDSVVGLMPLYSLRLRKGFGFGVEVGTTFGLLGDTSLISGGADVRLSLLEGFRYGALGYLPDIAATGSVRTITGTSQMQLTVASATGTISKGFGISGAGEITPWAGYQYLWIFGDSGIIDLTPMTDPQQYCGFDGPNAPGTPGSGPPYEGSPVCNGGSNADFNNNRVFAPARVQHHRLNFGLSYQYELLVVGGQFMYDLGSPKSDAALEELSSQWAFSLQAGASF